MSLRVGPVAGCEQCLGDVLQEEVEEVEQKVVEAEHSRSAARRFFTRFCTPVFLEAFVLTFLAGARPSTKRLCFGAGLNDC